MALRNVKGPKPSGRSKCGGQVQGARTACVRGTKASRPHERMHIGPNSESPRTWLVTTRGVLVWLRSQHGGHTSAKTETAPPAQKDCLVTDDTSMTIAHGGTAPTRVGSVDRVDAPDAMLAFWMEH